MISCKEDCTFQNFVAVATALVFSPSETVSLAASLPCMLLGRWKWF